MKVAIMRNVVLAAVIGVLVPPASRHHSHAEVVDTPISRAVRINGAP